MSHPVLWTKKTFFYPIGNTSPVCLSQDLPPEQNADILLLGCGDPRSILYTIQDASSSFQKTSRLLDFTCCDNEPAVLARNVILFTLIYEGHVTSQIWDIFYHFKVDADCVSVLIEHSKKLIAASENLETWSTSPYGTFLKFSSSDTLSKLRDHWEFYANSRETLKEKEDTLSSAFARLSERHHGNDGFYPGVGQSAGPFSIHATKVLSAHFEHYWASGSVRAAVRGMPSSAPLINPTFVYSATGEGCAVHYATYPLLCFHIASAYTATQNWEKIGIADFIACAFSQFGQWCSSFKAATCDTAKTVTIRMFSGDALQFSRALQEYRTTKKMDTHLYASPWSFAGLVLNGSAHGDGSMPTTFDIIDTSNLMDHLGLLNILVAAAPLLSHKSSSTLYTEAFLPKGDDLAKSFVRLLCTEICTISHLLGITPIAYFSGFTAHSHLHEVVSAHVYTRQRQSYHERVAWKTPYLGDAVAVQELQNRTLCPGWEAPQLAKVLFELYYQMFSDEDIENGVRNKVLPASVIHYHRGTFAALLGLVKSRTDGNWNLVMEAVFHLLASDKRLILGTNNYQELCCQLHIQGVYSADVFKPVVASLFDWSQGRFLGWSVVPPVICLVLVIPREKIKALEDADFYVVGQPMLQCDVRSPKKFHNIFSSIQMTFGSLCITGSNADARGMITEDAAGWLGTSSLIVSVWIPSHNLISDPSSTQIGFGLHSTPAATRALSRVLGPELRFHSASLMDVNSVFVLTERPNCPAELQGLTASAPISPKPAAEKAMVTANLAPLSLAIKWHVGTISPQTGAETAQVGPCTIQVILGLDSRNLVYPFPIDGTRSKIRIARKSGWIEVSAPIWEPRSAGGFNDAIFPMLSHTEGPPILWNFHRLSLNSSPILHPKPKNIMDTNLIGVHWRMSMSDRERNLWSKARQSGSTMTDSVLGDMKASLLDIFHEAAKHDGFRVFGLHESGDMGIYAVLFINHIRMDLSSHAIMADIVVLSFTPHRVIALGQSLSVISNAQQMRLIGTSTQEAVLWKHLLPCMTERCRTWSHSPTCEYVRMGRIPLSTDFESMSLCKCGEGKDLGAFSQVPRWQAFAPYATRAVLAPLYAVSFLESVGAQLNETSFNDTAEPIPHSPKESDGKSICVQCGSDATGDKVLLACSRCKKAVYCGKLCQDAHWKLHKRECKASK